MELLIVVTIMPLIIGALSLGIISVFSLQSSVGNRLGDSSDAQVISSKFESDVQSADAVTTQSSSSPQCDSGYGGTQLLGIQADEITTTGDPNAGSYLVDISYVEVNSNDGSSSGWSLVRLYCSGGNLTTPLVTTLAYDLPAAQAVPTVTCNTSNASCGDPSQGWISTTGVGHISLPITEPASKYSFTVTGSPANSTATSNQGSPVSASGGQACNLASPGTGPLAGQLCFVDFSQLTSGGYSDLLATEGGGCLEMAVSLGAQFNNDTLYFCLYQSSVSNFTPNPANNKTCTPAASIENPNGGVFVRPASLPTYNNAFLGNSNSSTAFYSGVVGDPALYMSDACMWQSTLTFKNISVVSSTGVPLTNWEIVSADAESTDNGEYIIWTTPVGTSLSVLPDNPLVPSPPDGNACGGGTTPSLGYQRDSANQIECIGAAGVGNKTGALMVEAVQPTSLTVVMQHYEAITFGLLLP